MLCVFYLFNQVQSLQSKKDSNVENKNHENHRKDCPLDKDELGLFLFSFT